MPEHPGALICSTNNKEIVITGDGRMLGDEPDYLWERYMLGESAHSLALEIEDRLVRLPDED